MSVCNCSTLNRSFRLSVAHVSFCCDCRVSSDDWLRPHPVTSSVFNRVANGVGFSVTLSVKSGLGDGKDGGSDGVMVHASVTFQRRGTRGGSSASSLLLDQPTSSS